MSLSDFDAHRYIKAVTRAVRAVGREEIMPRYLKVAHSRKDDGSLFTEADLAAQRALIRSLTAIAPLPVLAEEMTEAEQHAVWDSAAEDGFWCVDPIDGTTNFVSGQPYFAVSVALIRGGCPVLGVVYDPVRDEVFTAASGCGSSLDGQAMPLKEPPALLARTLAGIDFKRLPQALGVALVTHPPYASQRNLGASTLDWCYLAAGRLHVYLHGGQKLWDYAAGWLILKESGGGACTMKSEPYWQGEPWTQSVVAATTSELQEQWAEWVRINYAQPGIKTF